MASRKGSVIVGNTASRHLWKQCGRDDMLVKGIPVTKIWLIFAIVLALAMIPALDPVLAIDSDDMVPGENLVLGDEQTERVLEVDVLGRSGAVLLDGDGYVKTAWSANDWDETCFLIFLPGDRVIWEDDRIPELLAVEKADADDLNPTPTGLLMLSAFSICGIAENGSDCPLEFQGIEMYIRVDSMQLPPSYLGLETCYLDENGWAPVQDAGLSSDGILEMPLNESGCYAIFADLYASKLINLEANSLSISTSTSNLWEPVTFAIRTGELVTISSNITNIGGEQQAFEIGLMIDGVEVDSMEVELQSGERMQIMFVLSGYQPGEYEVMLAGLSGSFVVGTDINWFPILVTLLLGGFILGFAGNMRRTRPVREVKNAEEQPPREVIPEVIEAEPSSHESPTSDAMEARTEEPKEQAIPEEFLLAIDSETEPSDGVMVELMNISEPATEETELDEQVEDPTEEAEAREAGSPVEDQGEMLEIQSILEDIRNDMDQLKEIAIASLTVPRKNDAGSPDDGEAELQVEIGFLRENVLEYMENGGKTFDDLLENFQVEDEVMTHVLEDLIDDDLVKPIQKGNTVVFLRI